MKQTMRQLDVSLPLLAGLQPPTRAATFLKVLKHGKAVGFGTLRLRPRRG
jgi:hypothetical protein